MTGKLLKIVSYIILVIGIISSIMAAIVYGNVARYTPLAIAILLYCIFASLVLFLIVNAIGTILELTEEMHLKIYTKEETNKHEATKPTVDFQEQKVSKESWKCPVCGTLNAPGTDICKGCGIER